MYIESLVLWWLNDEVILVSKFFDGGVVRCFRFWYYMYGVSIGLLNVY